MIEQSGRVMLEKAGSSGLKVSPACSSTVATWIWVPAIKVTEDPADRGGVGEN